MNEASPRPWYRDPWPWILMSGAAIVVVAGLWTFAIAAATTDTLVTEDSYRKGLRINREIDCAHAQADPRTPSRTAPCRSD